MVNPLYYSLPRLILAITSVLQVIFVKTLERRRRRNRKSYLGNYRCDGFFGDGVGHLRSTSLVS